MNYFIMANTSRKSNYQNLQVNTVILTVLKMNILVVEWQDMQIKCSTHSRSTSNQTLFTHLSIPIHTYPCHTEGRAGSQFFSVFSGPGCRG